MFFYEWVVPFTALLAVIATVFYLTVKNREGAGIRIDGKTTFHKPDDDQTPPSAG